MPGRLSLTGLFSNMTKDKPRHSYVHLVHKHSTKRILEDFSVEDTEFLYGKGKKSSNAEFTEVLPCCANQRITCTLCFLELLLRKAL